jgi:UPF0271 protein
MAGRRVLLNMDLGELPGEPEELYELADIANIACGAHAGDETSMRRAVGLCRNHRATLGAHPSYPDREGFGRRAYRISAPALRQSVAEQCALLAAIARTLGEAIAFVKPHGALYHAAGVDVATAEALVHGALESLGPSITMIGPQRGALAETAARLNVRYAREGFADRAMRPDGSLVARGEEGALLVDPAAAAERARELASSGSIETVCVHGDTPGAEKIAQAVRRVLDAITAT